MCYQDKKYNVKYVHSRTEIFHFQKKKKKVKNKL